MPNLHVPDAVTAAFHKQIVWCKALGSPFTAELLSLLLTDLRQNGATARLVGRWPGDPLADAVPLRLAGALHALVLRNASPDLTAVYPPAAAHVDGVLRAAVLGVLETHDQDIRRFLRSPPQTNEVGRSAVLAGGFLEIAAFTSLPLRLLEIGASAGLNLLWDRYHYDFGLATWGDPLSSVRLRPEWGGALPRVNARITVSERMACDQLPICLSDPDQRLRLRAYVWADQTERLARLDGAIAVALASNIVVDEASAVEWVTARLEQPTENVATVLYHSIMWPYVSAHDKAIITAAIEAAGARSTDIAPLAWLRFEQLVADERPALEVTFWPGNISRRLATAQAHGSDVTWLG